MKSTSDVCARFSFDIHEQPTIVGKIDYFVKK